MYASVCVLCVQCACVFCTLTLRLIARLDNCALQLTQLAFAGQLDAVLVVLNLLDEH